MKTDTGETIRVTNNYSTRESSGMVWPPCWCEKWKSACRHHAYLPHIAPDSQRIGQDKKSRKFTT